ncbi:MAG: RND superfamily drug exporter [Chloroflexi bacterium CSP1-4]|nr:MAG: RND superfamily drug exporter [Chloroflexi bacterium CSP1-4]
MFERLGHLVIRLRFALLVAWIAAAAAAYLLAPSLEDVGTADETSFLPRDVESMQARDLLATAFPADASSGMATLVASRPGGLSEADRAYLGSLGDWILGPSAPSAVHDVVAGVQSADRRPELASLFRSADGVVELAQVQLSVAPFQRSANDAVDAIRERIDGTLPAGLRVDVTGPAGLGRDYLAAVAEGTDRTTLVTLVLVIVILLLIYRSPVTALVPLVTIGVAFLVSRGILGVLAQAGWKIPSLVDSMLVVLVFGVGTDYTIFLISRFREELARGDWRQAGAATVGRIGAVITASAATVVVGLGSMAVARFGLVSWIGPALAVTIVVTLVVGLTLSPALLGIAGDRIFWPRRVRFAGGAAASRADGVWGRVAGWITARPGWVAAAVLIALALPMAGVQGLRSSFDVIAELPRDAEARQGYDMVAAHLDRGQLLPITVLFELTPGIDPAAPAGLALVERTATRLAAIDGVGTVRSLITPTGDGAVPAGMRPSERLAEIAAGFELAPGADLRAAIAQLVGAETNGRLGATADYLDAVALAFPDVAETAGWRRVVVDLAAVRAAATAIAAAPSTPPSEALGALTVAGPRLASGLDALAATFRGRPDDLFLPTSLPGVGGESARAALGTYVSADASTVRLYVVTSEEPYSAASFETVGRLRDALATPEAGVSRAVMGGAIAEFADVSDTINGDFSRVSVITLAGILLVLALLLRSVVAPIYLVLTVLLSYGTSMGLASWIFQGLLGQPGVNYFIPLMVFVLLVALGSDYNIFLMSRVREESEGRELREGIRLASARTGAVITSAGVILAGTFAALTMSPLLVLVQVGVIVSLGVLIDTFIVRSLLVPAIAALLGDLSWWPLGRRGHGPSPAQGARH